MKLSKETIDTEDDEVAEFHPEAVTAPDKCGFCVSSHAPQACPKGVRSDGKVSPPVRLSLLIASATYFNGLLSLGHC